MAKLTVDAEDIMQSALRTMADNISKEADNLIEEEVEKFRIMLVRRKNDMVSQLMSAIEIQTQKDMYTGATQFNIFMRPNIVIKKEEY